MPHDILDILVVDDHYANRLLAKTLLVRQGHDVTLANDGKACLDICAQKAFDLIILDIQMPIMDGLTALRHLRKTSTDCPIFALTAYCEPKDIKHYLGAGFNTVLTKPLKKNDIELAWEAHKTQITKRYHNHPEYHLLNAQTLPVSSSPKTPVSIELLDENIITELCHVINPENRQRLLIAFWEEMDDLMSQMLIQARQINNSNTNTLSQFRKNAHSIKGTSINVGALRCSRLAAQLQNSPIEHIPDLLESLQHTFTLTRTALKKEFSVLKTTYHGLSTPAAR